MEKYLVDKEVRDKHYRIVGGLEAVELAVRQAQCMPSDRGTRALLETAQVALHKAVTSAWEYAEQQTTVSAGEKHG
jgi:hypothetical protein